MRKITLSIIAILLALGVTHAQSSLVITEINYNGPEAGTDTTEFIEIYNNTANPINLNGYTLTGVNYAFGNIIINAGDYFVIGVNSTVIENIFGINIDDQWQGGGLNNAGESIVIRDNLGVTVDSVSYDDASPWPSGDSSGEADGGGASIVLCDPNSDNNDGANWTASTTATGVTINLLVVSGSPGAADTSCSSVCNNSSSAFSITECTSYTVPSGDETYTTAGTYDVIDTIANATSCDSIMTITVTILPALTGTQNQTVCFGESIIVNGTTYDANNLNGTEVFTNIGTNNCDSTVNVNLTIQGAIDTSTTTAGLTVTSNQTGATYQWIDCNNGNSIISGQTNQNYTATINGDYAVITTMGNCSDNSACVNISTAGINNASLFNNVSIYPNPNQGLINIELGTLKNATLKVFSTTGQLVYNKEHINTSKHQFELNEVSGIYFVEICSNNKQQQYKLIIK